ncbi:lipopolysaccharide biosynthesis protein [Paenibacillus piri]|uniref:Uncharacterized protein n=1 Tax=Paenibacillus piri TaxID=2547395 RepID=A0A4R5KZ05_9BACL|nr:polysaccharide biosynthesis C-terminal domain-containing protein [Paenibacillus piri]TDG00311.1 hypothetical protein E1757_01310 [Paenibacillus piri]
MVVHNGETGLRNSSFVMQTIQTMISMFGVLAINVVSAIILSRGLSPDDRGIYLGITVWSGFILGLCDVGIFIAAIYLWGKSKESERKDVFTTLLVWASITGAVTVIIVMLLAGWMIKGHLGPGELTAAYIYYAVSFGGPLTSMISGVLAAEQRFALMNFCRVGVPTVLTALWAAYFFFGELSIGLCLITSAAISLINVIPYLWQVRGYLKSLGRFRMPLFKKGIWYGLRSHGGSVINVLGGSGTQILLFSLTPAALALFQTAVSATAILWAIPKAIGFTSLPNLVKEDRAQLHAKVCRFFRMTALSIALGAALLGLAEPYLIPFLFGQSYLPAVMPALLLLPSALFGGLADLLGNALNSTGRTLHNTVATAVYVGVTLGTMSLTIGVWGMNAAAVATLAGYFMAFLIRLVWYNVTIQRMSFMQMMPGYPDVQELVHYGLGMIGKLVRRRANSAHEA